MTTNIIKRFKKQALNHSALNHPYLQHLSEGKFINTTNVIADYALCYSIYSNYFTRYLAAVVSKLEDAIHRRLIIENLYEESGNIMPQDRDILIENGINVDLIEGIPHSKLFLKFQKSLDCQIVPDKIQEEFAFSWAEKVLKSIQDSTICKSLGIIGFGTEFVVKDIYKNFIEAIEKYTDINKEDSVFFYLHSIVDDDHADILVKISESFMNSENNIKEIEEGMFLALDLRCEFWNKLYERALKIK